MEHDLLIVETGVDGLCPRLAVSDIQAAPESGEVEMERERERRNLLWREVEEAESKERRRERKSGIRKREATQPQGRTKRH